MKKAILIFSGLIFLYSALIMLAKPYATAYLKHKIEHADQASIITVERIDLYYTPLSILFLNAAGDVSIKNFKRDQFKAGDIKVRFRWRGRLLDLDSITAKLLDGYAQGHGSIILGRRPAYVFKINFSNLDLNRFVRDFELNNRFLLSGLLNGAMTVSGQGQEFRIINGDFASPASGGDLTIIDTGFLENMANSSKLPPNLVVDSFKNYHYNNGLVRMVLDAGNLNFDVSMEGSTGKRSLHVVLHDFKLN